MVGEAGCQELFPDHPLGLGLCTSLLQLSSNGRWG